MRMDNFPTKDNFKQGIWNHFIILLVAKVHFCERYHVSLWVETHRSLYYCLETRDQIFYFNPICCFHEHEKLILSRVSVHEQSLLRCRKRLELGKVGWVGVDCGWVGDNLALRPSWGLAIYNPLQVSGNSTDFSYNQKLMPPHIPQQPPPPLFPISVSQQEK